MMRRIASDNFEKVALEKSGKFSGKQKIIEKSCVAMFCYRRITQLELLKLFFEESIYKCTIYVKLVKFSHLSVKMSVATSINEYS